MDLKVGDLVKLTNTKNEVVRKILEVRDTGYTWIYPDIPSRDFWSENSNDPFFELGWEKL